VFGPFQSNRIIRILGVFLFSLGVLLALALSVAAIWGDLEAHWFDASLSRLRDASLTTLRCPVVMTTGESSTITAAFTNPLDWPALLTVRTHVSNYLELMREENARFNLDPGETEKLAWKVTADDVVYGRFIFVQVLQFRKYPLPARLGSCGVLVLDLPLFTGGQWVALATAGSLLGMAAGLGLWIVANRPLRGLERDATWAMGVLAAITLAGLVVDLRGWWMAGVLLLVVTILLVGAITAHFANRSSRR